MQHAYLDGLRLTSDVVHDVDVVVVWILATPTR